MNWTTETIERQLSAFAEACRQAGLRGTYQRQEIYRELLLAEDHPSAEELHHRLRKSFPTISLDTVYRTLATFAGCGLISKVDTVESQGRYEVRLLRHHHLICSSCKEIIDFQWELLDTSALPPEIGSWGRIDDTHVVVYGVCRKCLG